MMIAIPTKVFRATLALAFVLLAGCALGPQRQPADSYDLGPPRAPVAGKPSIPATLLLADVTAPSWLDGPGIIYRLSYENNARPQAYANSRWVAPPAALLTQRLRSRFAASTAGVVTSGDGARADYTLRIELEDFSQSFTAASTSIVSLRVRASVVRPSDRGLVAQRVFTAERAAAPDARGAVAALGEASDEMIERLLEWTGGQVRSSVAK